MFSKKNLLFWFLFSFFFKMVFILLSIAFVTLLERKVLSYSQNRMGPNKVALSGLLQPVLDGVKLFSKEFVLLFNYNFFLFFLFPFLSFSLMILLWTSFSFFFLFNNLKFSVFFILVCVGVSVYLTLFIGWSSNSKYSLLGALRASAQSISYEVSLSIILLMVFYLVKSMNLMKMLKINIFFFFYITLPVLILLFISFLAETNRAPFDFAEGESELVSGFNVEYGSFKFSLIFLAEYGMIIFFSILNFLLTSHKFFFFSFSFLFLLLLVRSVFPRLRYDKLMYLMWFKTLPFSLFYFLFLFLLF